MTLELAIALIAFSAPITAAVMKLIPQRGYSKNADRATVMLPTTYLTEREFDNFRNELNVKLADMQTELQFIRERIT